MKYELLNGKLTIIDHDITQEEFDDVCNRNVFTELFCYYCPLLTNLPDMPGLTKLYCYELRFDSYR